MGDQADSRLMPSLDHISFARGRWLALQDLRNFIPFRMIMEVISSSNPGKNVLQYCLTFWGRDRIGFSTHLPGIWSTKTTKLTTCITFYILLRDINTMLWDSAGERHLPGLPQSQCFYHPNDCMIAITIIFIVQYIREYLQSLHLVRQTHIVH